jgi:hypothetical protein
MRIQPSPKPFHENDKTEKGKLTKGKRGRKEREREREQFVE